MHESLERRAPFFRFVFLYTCLLFYLDIKLFEKRWTFNRFCHRVVLGILKKHETTFTMLLSSVTWRI